MNPTQVHCNRMTVCVHVACIDFGNHKQFRVRIPQFRRLKINNQAAPILIQAWYSLVPWLNVVVSLNCGILSLSVS